MTRARAHRTTSSGRVARGLVLGTALSAALAACSLGGGTARDEGGDGGEGGGDQGGNPTQVVLVTHESFNLPEELVAKFEQDSGYQLDIRAAGDAGALTNKLVLTKDSPTGDVAFGVDNTFGTRAIDEGVFASYDAELPEGAEDYELPGDDEDALTPVDTGAVCVNIDKTWFAREKVEPPQTLEDLTDPAYKDLFVIPGATTSSPGMAFLLSTIAEYGEDWPSYWEELMANGAKLTSGWSDAYMAEFTQGGGKGTRPIVVSYDSSPAFTVDGKGGTTTAALLDTCFRQVEYVGVLDGAANPDGAEALVDFMVSPEVQAALPEAMYVFPVDESVELPADWAKFAEQPDETYEVDPEEIDANRDDWLQQWTEITTR